MSAISIFALCFIIACCNMVLCFSNCVMSSDMSLSCLITDSGLHAVEEQLHKGINKSFVPFCI